MPPEDPVPVAAAKTGIVRAGGGVLWRPGESGEPEIALVHRSRHDDWSLPKGKSHPEEHPLVTALREVIEETGHELHLGPFLTRVGYRLPGSTGSTRKQVWYWAMTAGPAGGPVDDEVDRLDWFRPDAAARRLTYALDREVLTAFRRTPPWTATVVVARPGPASVVATLLAPVTAGVLPDLRACWQALRATAAAADVARIPVVPPRILAAPVTRCVRTLSQAIVGARALGFGRWESSDPRRPVTERPAPERPAPDLLAPVLLNSALLDPERIVDLLLCPAASRPASGQRVPDAVVCVPGHAVPPLVTSLVRRAGGVPPPDPTLPRGGCWVVHLGTGTDSSPGPAGRPEGGRDGRPEGGRDEGSGTGRGHVAGSRGVGVRVVAVERYRP